MAEQSVHRGLTRPLCDAMVAKTGCITDPTMLEVPGPRDICQGDLQGERVEPAQERDLTVSEATEAL